MQSPFRFVTNTSIFLIMDYVIEIQGLRDRDNKFLPKEVAIVSLQGNVSGHWLISPPHTYDEQTHTLLYKQRRFKNEQVRIAHGCIDNPYKKSNCALKRAHVLREWLHSLLPEESRKNLP